MSYDREARLMAKARMAARVYAPKKKEDKSQKTLKPAAKVDEREKQLIEKSRKAATARTEIKPSPPPRKESKPTTTPKKKTKSRKKLKPAKKRHKSSRSKPRKTPSTTYIDAKGEVERAYGQRTARTLPKPVSPEKPLKALETDIVTTHITQPLRRLSERLAERAREEGGLRGLAAAEGYALTRLGAGFVEGLTAPVRPSTYISTAHMVYELATDKEARRALGRYIAEHPTEFALETAGSIIGGYISGTALSKALSKAGVGAKVKPKIEKIGGRVKEAAGKVIEKIPTEERMAKAPEHMIAEKIVKTIEGAPEESLLQKVQSRVKLTDETIRSPAWQLEGAIKEGTSESILQRISKGLIDESIRPPEWQLEGSIKPPIKTGETIPDLLGEKVVYPSLSRAEQLRAVRIFKELGKKTEAPLPEWMWKGGMTKQVLLYGEEGKPVGLMASTPTGETIIATAERVPTLTSKALSTAVATTLGMSDATKEALQSRLEPIKDREAELMKKAKKAASAKITPITITPPKQAIIEPLEWRTRKRGTPKQVGLKFPLEKKKKTLPKPPKIEEEKPKKKAIVKPKPRPKPKEALIIPETIEEEEKPRPKVKPKMIEKPKQKKTKKPKVAPKPIEEEETTTKPLIEPAEEEKKAHKLKPSVKGKPKKVEKKPKPIIETNEGLPEAGVETAPKTVVEEPLEEPVIEKPEVASKPARTEVVPPIVHMPVEGVISKPEIAPTVEEAPRLEEVAKPWQTLIIKGGKAVGIVTPEGKKVEWRTRKRGTPKQIGLKFPLEKKKTLPKPPKIIEEKERPKKKVVKPKEVKETLITPETIKEEVKPSIPRIIGKEEPKPKVTPKTVEKPKPKTTKPPEEEEEALKPKPPVKERVIERPKPAIKETPKLEEVVKPKKPSPPSKPKKTEEIAEEKPKSAILKGAEAQEQVVKEVSPPKIKPMTPEEQREKISEAVTPVITPKQTTPQKLKPSEELAEEQREKAITRPKPSVTPVEEQEEKAKPIPTLTPRTIERQSTKPIEKLKSIQIQRAPQNISGQPVEWRTRVRGTPRQIGLRFPLRTPITTTKRNIVMPRRLKSDATVRTYTINIAYAKNRGESLVVIGKSLRDAIDEAFEERRGKSPPKMVEVVDPYAGTVLTFIARGAKKGGRYTLAEIREVGAKYPIKGGHVEVQRRLKKKGITPETSRILLSKYEQLKVRRLIRDSFSRDRKRRERARYMLKRFYPDIADICSWSVA